MTKKAENEEKIEDAKKFLRELLDKNGRRVYTVLRHVSQSGMTRRISCLVAKKEDRFTKEPCIQNIDYWVSLVTQFSIDSDKGGLRVGGCNMDMGFHLVYSLSRRLYKDIYKYGDSGYVLEQQWI